MAVEESAVDESVVISAGKSQRGESSIDFSPDGKGVAGVSRADFRSPVVVSEQQQLTCLPDHAGFDRDVVVSIGWQKRIIQRDSELAFIETPLPDRGTMQFSASCVGFQFVKPVGFRFGCVVHHGTDKVVVVDGILQVGDAILLLIGDTVDLSPPGAYFVQGRQQESRQNRDDRYFIDLRKYFFYVCLCQWRIGKGLMIPIDTMYNNIGLSALCFTSM